MADAIARTGIEMDIERRQREPAAAESQAHNGAVLEDMRLLMGDDWMMAALARLNAGLGSLLEAASDAPAEIPELRRRAHWIAGEAGQLGFAGLAICCGDLEAACRHGRDVRSACQRVRQAAGLSRTAIEEILAGRGAIRS